MQPPAAGTPGRREPRRPAAGAGLPLQAWGRRLSETLAAALAAGDLETAARLLREGDGQARNLATEYALMIRGLGITCRVMLPLLADLATGASAAELAVLLQRLRADLAGMPAAAGLAAGAQSPPEPRCGGAGTLPRACAEELAPTSRALQECEARFALDQAQRADEIAAVIAAGDAARALALLEAKDRAGYEPLHDRLIRFMADGFAWVLRHHGAQALLRLHLDTAEGQRAGFEKWERMPVDEFARATAFLLRQHLGQVTVREDAERYTIEQAPCGSGGRLRLAGAYAGSDALPFVEAAGPLTFGEARMPVYCSHCAIWNGAATLRWFGRAHWVFERPARPDGSCTLHVYKRRDATPPDYARRVAVSGQPGIAQGAAPKR